MLRIGWHIAGESVVAHPPRILRGLDAPVLSCTDAPDRYAQGRNPPGASSRDRTRLSGRDARTRRRRWCAGSMGRPAIPKYGGAAHSVVAPPASDRESPRRRVLRDDRPHDRVRRRGPHRIPVRRREQSLHPVQQPISKDEHVCAREPTPWDCASSATRIVPPCRSGSISCFGGRLRGYRRSAALPFVMCQSPR